MSRPRNPARRPRVLSAEQSAEAARRARDYLSRRKAEGWRPMGVLAPPEDHANLSRIVAATGETKIAVLTRLLAAEAARLTAAGA